MSGIQEGHRLPSVPQFQAAAAATYQWQMEGSSLGYVTGTYQHIGSRYTQVGDEEPGFGVVNLLSFAPNTIGGPLTAGHLHASTRSCRPTTSSTCGSASCKGNWDVALYVNNLTDERAFLALDRERGTARPRGLPDQPAAGRSASRPASSCSAHRPRTA